MGARNSEKNEKAIETIKAEYPTATGQLIDLPLNLADLPSIKKSAEGFLGKAERLDVLIHNAGIMTPPTGSKTALVSYLEPSPDRQTC